LLHAEPRICCYQKELLEPAVKGTLSVLRAAKDSGVGRVVLMSSQVAIAPNPNWPADKIIDEDSWADVEHFKKLEVRTHEAGVWTQAARFIDE
jgi:nucleoside-diphosphate-sugar epimerase